MLRVTSVAIASILLVYATLGKATAHHDDNDGDTGHQLTFFASMEMNSVFEGSVNVRAVLADRAGALPATGGGGSHSSLRWVALASGIVLLTGAAISWAGARGRRRS